VNLALGTETIAGLAVTANPVNVNLALGTETIAGLAVTARVGIGAPIATGTVTVRGFPLTAAVTKNLIIAIATEDGVDPITGAVYVTGINNFDPANAQHYINILDQTLTAIFPGVANPGGLQFFTPGQYNLITGQNVIGDTEAGVFIYSGAVSGLVGNQSLMQLFASQIQLLNASNNIPGPHVSGFPVSGSATLATTIAALNNLYNALVNMGIQQP
jgi:hypothetical protein